MPNAMATSSTVAEGGYMDVPFAGFDSTDGAASSKQHSGYMDVSASAHAHVTGTAGDSGSEEDV